MIDKIPENTPNASAQAQAQDLNTTPNLPFLIQNLRVALIVAYVVVAVEPAVIAAIRHRYFGTKWSLSILQVVGGGVLVFAAGFIFGSA